MVPENRIALEEVRHVVEVLSLTLSRGGPEGFVPTGCEGMSGASDAAYVTDIRINEQRGGLHM